ncbi:M24 family metallopeptidase [Haloplanus vescus]|uniref:M24 family metallopeptidase n=1 Tax=Haloplanus vescus TaxID=555874 RepID=UPI000B89D298|nr:M24 family metallopeptidase [Haloplanus vescus]
MTTQATAAAEAGIVAVATRLASADVSSLSPATLERLADEAIERAGADPDGATTVEPGTLRPAEPIVVAVAPRADGRRAPLARTFVVDGRGGWERRAAVAVEMAHDAVGRVAEPGVTVQRITDEAIAELGAYGLAPGEGPVVRPLDGSDSEEFEVGDRFVLDPAATDPDPDTERCVRVSGRYVVTDDGCRREESVSTSLSPSAY